MREIIWRRKRAERQFCYRPIPFICSISFGYKAPDASLAAMKLHARPHVQFRMLGFLPSIPLSHRVYTIILLCFSCCKTITQRLNNIVWLYAWCIQLSEEVRVKLCSSSGVKIGVTRWCRANVRIVNRGNRVIIRKRRALPGGGVPGQFCRTLQNFTFSIYWGDTS